MLNTQKNNELFNAIMNEIDNVLNDDTTNTTNELKLIDVATTTMRTNDHDTHDEHDEHVLTIKLLCL